MLAGDEGVFASDAEKMARLKPVKEGGTITFAGQTHPADGNAGMIITTAARARALSREPRPVIRIAAYGQAREKPAYMPAAPIAAARRALAAAGIAIEDVKAVKSHNPFAVNDIIFAKELGLDVMTMNNYGCSLIWGHPQGPTGLRAIIELIEELVLAGGGYGLFHGCAAGDSAMAVGCGGGVMPPAPLPQRQQGAVNRRVVIAALYRFVKLPDFEALKGPLLQRCLDLGLSGTFLLAPEGINGAVAGRAGGDRRSVAAPAGGSPVRRSGVQGVFRR